MALIESTKSIYRATGTCIDTASVLSSEVSEDVTKKELVYLSAFSTGVFSETSSSEDEDDDEVSTLGDQAPKLFKKIVRRRSSVHGMAMQLSRPRRHSITAAVIQAAPAVFSSAGWDFTHQLALSTIARFLPSRGIFRYFCGILGLYSAMLEPYADALFAPTPTSVAVQDTRKELISKLEQFEKFSAGTPMHPAATSILMCIFRVRSCVTSCSDETSLYRGESGMNILARDISALLGEWKELAIDHASTLAIIAKAHALLEEVLCKLEGMRRVQIFVKACRDVICNIEMTAFPLDTGDEKSSPETFIFKKFAHMSHAKKSLMPLVDIHWIEYLKAQEKAVRVILHQRQIMNVSDHMSDVARLMIYLLFVDVC